MVAALHDVRIMFQGRGKKAGVHFRVHVVVRVRKADVKAPRRIQPRVPCGGNARVLLVQEDDSAVLFLPAEQVRPGIVHGAVIDADDFNVPEGLPNQAVQTVVHISGYIVAGNDDGNVGTHKLIMYVTDLQSVVNDNFCKINITEGF